LNLVEVRRSTVGRKDSAGFLGKIDIFLPIGASGETMLGTAGFGTRDCRRMETELIWIFDRDAIEVASSAALPRVRHETLN